MRFLPAITGSWIADETFIGTESNYGNREIVEWGPALENNLGRFRSRFRRGFIFDHALILLTRLRRVGNIQRSVVELRVRR